MSWEKCWETIVLPGLSSVTVGFGCDADVGFEETVEERYVVKTEVEGNLFDLAVGDLQLALGVRDDGFYDDVTGCSFSNGFDGGTEVRQGETHSIRILADMMPFVVMLQDKLAVVLVDLRFAVKRFDEVFVLFVCVLGVRGAEKIEDMYHFLGIEHGRCGIQGSDDGFVHLVHDLCVVFADGNFGRMEL